MDTCSLKQFLTRSERIRVVIPVIQRDYAQGRSDPMASGVRDRFLRHLHEALQPDVQGPLVLDFVYGTQRPGRAAGELEFTPLDGQQRLTTLWLLHWYLALRERRMAEFRSFGQVADAESPSRFAYEVRPSSKEFFGALVTEGHALTLPPVEEDSNRCCLATTIRDQPWFLHAWDADPTVRASLTMLDDIHGRFHDCEGAFDRLTDESAPAVVFHLLDLERYGLSDDLYIRMNARGRPLTAFEVFKAELERHLQLEPTGKYSLDGRDVDAREYAAHRWETTWGDFFWRFRGLAGDPNTYDAEIMNLVRTTCIVTLPWYVADPRKAQNNMVKLRGDKEARFDDVDLSFADLRDHQCGGSAYFEQLFAWFDAWASWPAEAWAEELDYARVFRGAMEGPQRRGDRGLDWDGLVRFTAFCEAVRRQLSEPDREAWCSYFGRLATATRFDKVDEVEPTVRSIHNFPEVPAGQLHSVIATHTGPLERFHRQQVDEERVKSQLRLAHAGWALRLDQAQAHPWFAGQIEFLLDFAGVLERWDTDGKTCAWPDEVHQEFQGRFDHYLVRAELMFNAKGLWWPSEAAKKDLLWERAILVFDDPFFHYESENFVLPVDNDRDRSWKRFLRAMETPKVPRDRARARRQAVRQVLDVLEPDDVEGSLRRLLAQANQKGREFFRGPAETVDWRVLLVEDVRLLRYCSKRQICFSGGDPAKWTTIFLMSSIRRTAPHVDLFLYRLRMHLSQHPGALAKYDPVSGYETPHCVEARIRPDAEPVCIFSRGGKYLIYVLDPAIAPQGVHVELLDGGTSWTISFDDVAVTLLHIADEGVQTVRGLGPAPAPSA